MTLGGRMILGRPHPVNLLQYTWGLQRDWARTISYEAVTDIAKEYAGGYGLGLGERLTAIRNLVSISSASVTPMSSILDALSSR